VIRGCPPEDCTNVDELEKRSALNYEDVAACWPAKEAVGKSSAVALDRTA